MPFKDRDVGFGFLMLRGAVEGKGAGRRMGPCYVPSCWRNQGCTGDGVTGCRSVSSVRRGGGGADEGKPRSIDSRLESTEEEEEFTASMLNAALTLPPARPYYLAELGIFHFCRLVEQIFFTNNHILARF